MTPQEFLYTGNVQEMDVSEYNSIKVNLYGANGGITQGIKTSARGAFISGIINTLKLNILYLYIGGVGESKNWNIDEPGIGGWNGGAKGGYDTYGGKEAGAGGGGATDIRLVKASDKSWYDTSHSSWDTDKSLLSRIIVAGGAGGNGGDWLRKGYNGDEEGKSGDYVFGIGQVGMNAQSGAGGGGGGWYGGTSNRASTSSYGGYWTGWGGYGGSSYSNDLYTTLIERKSGINEFSDNNGRIIIEFPIHFIIKNGVVFVLNKNNNTFENISINEVTEDIIAKKGIFLENSNDYINELAKLKKFKIRKIKE